MTDYETQPEFAVSTFLPADLAQCESTDPSHPDNGYSWRCRYGLGHPGDCVNPVGFSFEPPSHNRSYIETRNHD